MSAEPDADFATRVAAVVEIIRPALQIDGGDVELIAIETRDIKLRFSGPYVSDPLIVRLLKMGAERTLRDSIPDLGGVIADTVR